MTHRLLRLGLLLVALSVFSGRSFAVPHFLLLPFKDTNIKLQQGWMYNFGDISYCGHQGIDFINGTVDKSSTWRTFEVYPAAAGEATLHHSGTYGDYVTIKTVVDGTTYYTLYAHLDDTQPKLKLETPTPVTRDIVIGMAGKTGSASNGVLHLHFELSENSYARATSCPVHNTCGNCRIDPYGVYSQRSSYPPYSNYQPPDYYWKQYPPSTTDSRQQQQGDFTVSSIITQTINQGDTATFPVIVHSLSGFVGTVNLVALNIPPGYDASRTTLSPSAIFVPLNGTVAATLAIATNRGTQTGRFVMTLKGTSSALTRTQYVELIINPAPDPTPYIKGITLPSTRYSGRQFIAGITGGNINPSNVRVVVVGPGCNNFGSCVVPNNVLRQFGAVSTTQITSVPMTLGIGSYQVYIQNGNSSPASNSYTITLTR